MCDRESWDSQQQLVVVRTEVIDKLRSRAPRAFAPTATQLNQLKLVIQGEEFHWEPEPKRKWSNGKP